MWILVKAAEAVSEKKPFKTHTILYMHIAQGRDKGRSRAERKTSVSQMVVFPQT